MENNPNNQKPFIKKFKTKNRRYIYDVNSNDLLGVNPVVYDIIDEYPQNNIETIIEIFKDSYPAGEIKENYELIDRMGKERNYFSTNRPQITSGINSVDTVRSALESGLRQIENHGVRSCITTFDKEWGRAKPGPGTFLSLTPRP